MHIISKRPFRDVAEKHPNQREALMDIYRVLSRNSTWFSTPEEMRSLIPSLDNFKHKDKWWVFNVGGNHLRIIAFIQFVQNRMYVKHIVTHAEYDKLCERYTRGEL